MILSTNTRISLLISQIINSYGNTQDLYDQYKPVNCCTANMTLCTNLNYSTKCITTCTNLNSYTTCSGSDTMANQSVTWTNSLIDISYRSRFSWTVHNTNSNNLHDSPNGIALQNHIIHSSGSLKQLVTLTQLSTRPVELSSSLYCYMNEFKLWANLWQPQFSFLGFKVFYYYFSRFVFLTGEHWKSKSVWWKNYETCSTCLPSSM